MISTVEICGPGALSDARSPIVIGVLNIANEKAPGRGAELAATELGISIESLLAVSDCDGSPGSIGRAAIALAGQSVHRILFIGLGDKPDAVLLGKASMLASAHGGAVSTLALEIPNQNEAVRAIVEGHLIGRYRPGHSEADADPTLKVVTANPEKVAAETVSRATDSATAVNWVRSLVDSPSGELTPPKFADAILQLAKKANVRAELWDAKALHERGFGGTLAVGAASPFEPCAVVISNQGSSKTKIGLAGKGITFDSGGINLKKNPSELVWMKSDMAAGAAVAASAIEAIRRNPDLNLTAVIPIAENMIGAGAIRPGDVISHPRGRTTEVADTDSEGRIILADAIDWLCSQSIDLVVDVGTLTDGGGVGPELWGCWSASAEEYLPRLLESGQEAGEPGWHLPLRDSYASILESRIADSINAPLDRPDTGQTAATFLRGFVGQQPWIHIDNGSTAWQEFDLFPWRVGPTGSPVRALIRFLADLD
ncbi:MAG: hypothetical protein IT192_00670 [Microbacteriaceae bacterium]|nr:hypothetical protein [Microbacteriaceae bacterium]